MKTLILILLLCGLWAAGHAQTETNAVTIEQIEAGSGENGMFTDGDLLEQYAGITGIPSLQQQAGQVAHIQMSGRSNQAHITQTGTGNIGAITIAGMFNESTLNQSGSNLLSLIDINGRSNRLEVNQRGHNLSNLVQVLGSGIDVNITQNPAGFHYRQAGAANPITITSTARNVPVIIRNN